MGPGFVAGTKWCPVPGSVEHHAQMHRPYRSRIGSMLWLSRGTRPIISYITGTLSTVLENPGERHWQEVDHVLRFLSTSVNTGITYRREAPTPELYGAVDAEAVANGELVLEYVCTSEQSADCLTKALPAPAIACAEARMSGRSTEPAAHWTRRERSLCAMGDARAEHEWLELDYTREKVERGDVKVVPCRTDDMLADILTKCLGPDKQKHFWTILRGYRKEAYLE